MRERLELRSQEPVARCLMRQLVVPRVYFDVVWPGLNDARVDVLAIDRDGVGDAHVVEIKKNARDALDWIPKLLQAKAPYRWIAFLHGTETAAETASLNQQDILFPRDTAGRIGVIEIVEMAGGDLGANVRIKAERFPTPTYDLAAAFTRKHQANIQFGEVEPVAIKPSRRPAVKPAEVKKAKRTAKRA